MHLRKEEKALLWKKYRRMGLSEEESSLRLKKFVNHLNSLVEDLKSRKKSKEYIEIKFKEEFFNLCQSLES